MKEIKWQLIKYGFYIIVFSSPYLSSGQFVLTNMFFNLGIWVTFTELVLLLVNKLRHKEYKINWFLLAVIVIFILVFILLLLSSLSPLFR